MQEDETQTGYLSQQRQRNIALRAEPAKLCRILHAKGVTQVDMYYDAYDDSGAIENVDVLPLNIQIDENLQCRLKNFGFDFAYDLNPGFKIDGGATGQLIWQMQDDKINLRHETCYREYTVISYEGL